MIDDSHSKLLQAESDALCDNKAIHLQAPHVKG